MHTAVAAARTCILATSPQTQKKSNVAAARIALLAMQHTRCTEMGIGHVIYVKKNIHSCCDRVALQETVIFTNPHYLVAVRTAAAAQALSARGRGWQTA